MSKINFRLKSKRFIFPALGILLVLTLIGIFVFQSKKPVDNGIETIQAQAQDIRKSVLSTGKVVPNFEVEIKGKASGAIVRLPYDVSDVVKKGDLLVELDPIDESRNVNQAQASLASVQGRVSQSGIDLSVAKMTLQTDIARAQADLSAAQAKSTDANAKTKRAGELVKNRYISQEEYETSLATQAQAKTDMQNAQVRLRELKTSQLALQSQAKNIAIASADAQAQRVALATAQQRLSETKIYAPISGVVTSRAGQIGQIVASGISNVSGGTAIMTLADLSHIFVLATVDESDIGQVRPGQEVIVTADAFPEEKFSGQVMRIAPKGFEETNVVTFEVKIEVISPNKQLLKPEMTTNIEILLAQKANAVVIPVEALNQRNGKTFVRVIQAEGKAFARRAVITGINNGTEVEIVSGLKAGETIVNGAGNLKSKWNKETSATAAPGMGNRRNQRMMMRGMGGGGRRG